MAVRKHNDVMAGLDLLAARGMKKAQDAIREQTTDPVLRAVESIPESGDDAADYVRMATALNDRLLLEMGTDALAESLAETNVQAALIGRTAATPATLLKEPAT